MSQELFEIRSFGKTNQIKFVLGLICQAQAPLPLSNLKKYCTDSSSQYFSSFDGIIQLLEMVDYVTCLDDSVYLNNNLEISPTLNENVFLDIPTRFLSKLIDLEIIDDFISLDCLDYDVFNSNFIIKNSSIPLRASALKQLFIDTEVFQISNDNNSIYFLNSAFIDYFESSVVPNIQKRSKFVSEAGLTYEEFQRLQMLKAQYGEQAEIFVEHYEKNRLDGHPELSKIKKISQLKVNAGYDVISFNSIASKSPDRFIEVKSFSKFPEFYLSKNELATAEQKRNKYFLYLVDRSKIDNVDYHPTIIQDPYVNVFQNDQWKKDPQNWLIKPQLQ